MGVLDWLFKGEKRKLINAGKYEKVEWNAFGKRRKEAKKDKKRDGKMSRLSKNVLKLAKRAKRATEGIEKALKRLAELLVAFQNGQKGIAQERRIHEQILLVFKKAAPLLTRIHEVLENREEEHKLEKEDEASQQHEDAEDATLRKEERKVEAEDHALKSEEEAKLRQGKVRKAVGKFVERADEWKERHEEQEIAAINATGHRVYKAFAELRANSEKDYLSQPKVLEVSIYKCQQALEALNHLMPKLTEEVKEEVKLTLKERKRKKAEAKELKLEQKTSAAEFKEAREQRHDGSGEGEAELREVS